VVSCAVHPWLRQLLKPLEFALETASAGAVSWCTACGQIGPGSQGSSSHLRGSRSAFNSQNHRMFGVGRALCGSLSPTPAEAGSPEQAAQDRVQVGLQYLQRRRLHNLPGQPVWGATCFSPVPAAMGGSSHSAAVLVWGTTRPCHPRHRSCSPSTFVPPCGRQIFELVCQPCLLQSHRCPRCSRALGLKPLRTSERTQTSTPPRRWRWRCKIEGSFEPGVAWLAGSAWLMAVM